MDGHYRWANVVTLRNFRTDAVALTYPSNLEDRTVPRLFRSLNERPVITREGWVLGQHYQRVVDMDSAVGWERLRLANGSKAKE